MAPHNDSRKLGVSVWEGEMKENEPLVPHQYLRERVSELRYFHIFPAKQKEWPVVASLLCTFVT